MTVKNWLARAVMGLVSGGIATANLDSELLLSDELGETRTWLAAHTDQKLTAKQSSALNTKLKRRLNHEPLAYIRGRSEFFGREFLVSPSTLQPRPETETMITLLLDLMRIEKPTDIFLVDVGSGSGCLAVTAKLELPAADVAAVEINKKALAVAEKNAAALQAEVTFHHGSLLEPLKDKLPDKKCVILANLPYVPDHYEINRAASHEPKIAIFGGPDGLNIYRKLFQQLTDTDIEFVLTESLPPQHDELAKIAKTAGYKLLKTDDFIQLFERI